MKTDTVKIALPPETAEQEARRLRQQIYGPISDTDWFKIAENWVKDLAWLRRAARGD
jgi:hypothetical protein